MPVGSGINQIKLVPSLPTPPLGFCCLVLWLACASLGFYDLCWRDNVEPPGIPAPLNLLQVNGYLLPLPIPNLNFLVLCVRLTSGIVSDLLKHGFLLFGGFFRKNTMRHLYLILCSSLSPVRVPGIRIWKETVPGMADSGCSLNSWERQCTQRWLDIFLQESTMKKARIHTKDHQNSPFSNIFLLVYTH